MKVKVVLNGGIRSCCSNYPPELVKEIMRDWLRPGDELEVIDRQQENWQPNELASLAEKYFGEAIFPLLYIEDTLVTVGDLPDKEMLNKMLSEKEKYALSEEDILEAAKKQNLLK